MPELVLTVKRVVDEHVSCCLCNILFHLPSLFSVSGQSSDLPK